VWVFRPEGYPLPPARGRDGIEFRPDGTAQAYAPGPVDAPVDRPPATWVSHPDGTLLLRSSEGEAWFDILTLTEDLLRLAPRDPPNLGPIG
jgi:hypothetical protein